MFIVHPWTILSVYYQEYFFFITFMMLWYCFILCFPLKWSWKEKVVADKVVYRKNPICPQQGSYHYILLGCLFYSLICCPLSKRCAPDVPFPAVCDLLSTFCHFVISGSYISCSFYLRNSVSSCIQFKNQIKGKSGSYISTVSLFFLVLFKCNNYLTPVMSSVKNRA